MKSWLGRNIDTLETCLRFAVLIATLVAAISCTLYL